MLIQTLISGSFSKMNEMSSSLQGKLTVFIADDKIQAFKQKLEFWRP
jgi:hypothetical protein